MRLTLRILFGLVLYMMLPVVVGLVAFAELAAPKNGVPRPTPTINAARVAQNRVRAEDLYRSGATAFHAGDYATAVAKFREALRLTPSNGSWHNSLGLALAGQGRIDEAETEYQAAIANEPSLADAYYNLGGVYQQRGEFDPAQSSYRAALALQPGMALAHNNLGTLYMGRGLKEQARDEFMQAVDLEPNLARAHLNLGLVLGDLSDWARAATEFEFVTRLDSQSAEAFYYLGMARGRIGQKDGARSALQATILIAPNTVWGTRAQTELDKLAK